MLFRAGRYITCWVLPFYVAGYTLNVAHSRNQRASYDVRHDAVEFGSFASSEVPRSDDYYRAYSFEHNLTLYRDEMFRKLQAINSTRVKYVTTKDMHGIKSKMLFQDVPPGGYALFILDDPFQSCCKSNYFRNSFLNDPRILIVAAENWQGPPHPKVLMLPIGFESKLMVGRYGSNVLEKFVRYVEQPVEPEARIHAVMSDAQMSTYDRPMSKDRNDRKAMIDGVNISAVDDWYTRSVSRSDHLDRVAGSQMALCPEGNALDTHRFYHNYAMGVRCIVRDGPMTRLHALFPGTIVVNDWSQVTPENVRRWVTSPQPERDLELLTSKYWITKALRLAGLTELLT